MYASGLFNIHLMGLKKRFFILIIFTLLIFVGLTYQSAKSDLDTSRFGYFIYPLKILEKRISIFSKGIKNFFRSYILIVGKEDENRRLLEQIKKIEKEKNQYIEAQYENERLRALLELKSQRPDFVAVAEVFARDPTNWFQIMHINKGARDSISKDMIAVTPSGVVGRIQNVLSDTAKVILITDVNSSVAVRMQSSRAEGILEGSGDTRCHVKYVSRDVDVVIGDKVITSGLDGIYPEGLQIAYVANVRQSAGDFFQVIEVVPSQDFRTIEEIVILKK